MSGQVTVTSFMACPVCQKALDAHMLASEDDGGSPGPEPGDFTICAGCLSILTYGKTNKLHYVDENAFMALPLPLRAELSRARIVVLGLTQKLTGAA